MLLENLIAASLFQPLYNGALQGYAATMAGGIALIASLLLAAHLLVGLILGVSGLVKQRRQA